MASRKKANDQIPERVTQANVKELGEAPAVPMGNLYQATAQAVANAAHNATTAEDEAWEAAQAVTTMGVATLHEIDTASTGIASEGPRHEPQHKRAGARARKGKASKK